MPQLPATKLVKAHGLRFRVYSIGWLAHLTNRSSDTVRRWERLGVLPRPIIEIPNNAMRWYTVAELHGYARIYLDANVRPKVPIESTGIKQRMHSFNVKLRSSAQTDPTVLGRHLDREEDLRQVMTKRKEAKWKEQLQKILASV